MDFKLLLKREYLTKHDFYRDVIDFFVFKANSKIGYLHFFDDVTQEIALNVWSTSVLEHCHTSHETHYPLSSAGIWADSIRNMSPIIHNQYDTKYHTPDALPEGHIPLYHHFSVPVVAADHVVAVIGIGNGQETYTDEMVDQFWQLANRLWPEIEAKALEIEQSNSHPRLHFETFTSYTVLVDMLGAISRALEIRDEYTSAHQRNVAYICGLIADDLDLEAQQKEGLVIGALVHDIGKITIPSQLLNKTGKLLPAEFELLKSHSEVGASIFSNVAFPWPVLKIIEQHHERLNGSGYPKGFKGKDIVLEARIVAVADTFDAMASDRPYRKAQGAEKAIETLISGRNTLYDPYVVDAFLRCYELDPTFDGRYTSI